MNDKCVLFWVGGFFGASHITHKQLGDFDHTLGSPWHLYNEFTQIVHPIKLDKQKCAVFCKNVFISIATSASRLSVLTNAEWIEDSATATFYAGLLKRKRWREKCVFHCFNDDTSFKVLQCDWNGPTLHLCPVNILSKRDWTHLYQGLWYLLNCCQETLLSGLKKECGYEPWQTGWANARLNWPVWCGCLDVKPGWAFTKMLLTRLRKRLCRQRMQMWNYSPYLTLQLNWEFMGCRITNFHRDQGRIWIWLSESKDGWWKWCRGCGL